MALGEIAVGLVCGALLVWHQSGRTNALLPLDLLKIPLLSLSLVTSICSYSAQILAYVSLPFLFETVMHRSQIATRPAGHALAADDRDRGTARRPPQREISRQRAARQHRPRPSGDGSCRWPPSPTSPRTGILAWRMALCGIGFSNT